MIEQKIEIRTDNLKDFERLAESSNISYSLEKFKIGKSYEHIGTMKGEQIDVLRFVRNCGDWNVPIYFPKLD